MPLSSSDTTEGTVSPSSVTFTSINWNTNQTITVTGVDDATVDGNISYTIVTGAAISADTNYNGINPSDVSVSNTDNDVVVEDGLSCAGAYNAGPVTSSAYVDLTPQIGGTNNRWYKILVQAPGYSIVTLTPTDSDYSPLAGGHTYQYLIGSCTGTPNSVVDMAGGRGSFTDAALAAAGSKYLYLLISPNGSALTYALFLDLRY